MFLIQRISIRLRFYLVLGTVSLSLVVLGVWGWVSGEQLRQDTTALFNASDAAATQIAALRESLGRVRRWESAAIAIGNSNAEQVEVLITRWRQEVARARDTAAALRQTHADDATIAPLLDSQRQQLQVYATLMGPTLTQLQAGVTDSISALATAARADALFAGLEAQTAQLVTALTAQEAQAREQMAAQASAASLLRLGLVVATLLLYVPLMWLTLRSVCQPLDRAVAIASRIAGGDLSQSIAITGQDETAQLLQAIASMQTALGGVVGDVREAAESIRLASAEVASGNLDLSNRTEQTASDLQRSASLVRALTQTVQHSAASAGRANQLAASAADVAAQGGTVVAQVVDTMQGINQSSHKISSIIAVIDTIAFQTNILALNAAVEAARAGEQGRGFAVVASEVRNLATRSAQAAREIKGLISDSVHGVEAGSQLVGTAGQTMGSIVASVQRVTEAIAEISSAAAEQSAGMDHINSTLGALDQMTQQNAALVEQSAAAAESLCGHAEKLTQMVGTFRLAPSSSLSLLPS